MGKLRRRTPLRNMRAMLGSGCIWGGLALLPVQRDFEFERKHMDFNSAAFMSRFSGASPYVFRAITNPRFLSAPTAWPDGLPWGDNPPTPAEVANVLNDGLFVGAVGRKNITRDICALALWCAGADPVVVSAASGGVARLENAVTQLRNLNGFNLWAANVDLHSVPFRNWGFQVEDAEHYAKLYTTPYTVPSRLVRPMFSLQGWTMLREGMMTARSEPRITRLHSIMEQTDG